ncbi:armadillo-type protein, partial [Phycomyces blakesleeanus]
MLRRPRADTMPSQASFPYPPMFGGLAPVQATRHRSGSVNLPSDHDSPMTRNRAYTVATRAPLDRPDLNRIAPGLNFSPFSPQTLNAVQTRPRATSMGMADGAMMNSFSPFDINSFQQRIPTRFQPPQVVVSAEPEQPEHTLRNTYSSGNLFDMNRDMTGSDSFTVWSGFDTSSPGTQIPSRALWLGNVNPSLSVPDLIQLFSCYGTVESARILSDKECAFVNFSTVESAVAAKADLETRLGNKVAGTPVRVGFGKADVSIAMALTNEAGPNAQGPTRALWVGNIPANINPALLRALFQTYGPIESVRVLSHKNCGFVNFEHQEDAVKARKSLQNKEVLGPGTGPVRIGFAKVPATPSEDSQGDESAPSTNPGTPDNYQATQWATAMMMTSMMMRASGQPQPLSSSQPTSLYTAIAAERCFIMQQLGCVGSLDEEEERAPVTYSSAIPILPEIGADRHLEPLRLREMRKGLDSGQGLSEVESMVDECMDEIVELCSDYVGNTVIQKLFEYCTEDTKERMLSAIGPYLASIGVHKNGTWAAQKIIDYAHTEGQMQLVCTHVAPYVPLLLLDQFGNYVVQCSLRMGPEKNQYIFDAIVDKCWEIGQGRFGARAVRAILENPVVTKKQQVYCAAAIVQNAVLLTTNTNGALLLLWLLDTSELPGRYRVLCPRLLPYLTKLCTHKLGSMTVFKVISQRQEPDASQLLLNAI